MRKCCFIVPYFGKLPNYFQLFLKSCEANPTFDWLFFTDDISLYNYPANVHVVQMQFEDLKRIIQSKFDFNISLDRPYKLCDYRPAYGYLFAEYLKEYKYWGHCDIDTIMGNLEKFFPDEFLDKYDKILCLGHCTIYRNDMETNVIFKKELNGEELYKKVLSTPKSWAFDEDHPNENINRIFEHYGYRVYHEDISLNIEIRRTKFIRTNLLYNEHIFVNERYVNALYLWDAGNICRYFRNGNQLIREDFPYIHLQKRKMKMDTSVLNSERFKIIPNAFLPLEIDGELTCDNFSKVKKTGFCMHAWEVRWPYYKKRFVDIIRR